MKDLSIEKIICRIDEDNPICAKDGDVFRRLVTDDMTIVGSMKIIQLDSKMVSTINPKFKPDTLVQLIRDPESDFNDTEEDITGLCYIEKYDDDLEGFSVVHIQKKSTGIEDRPYTLIAPSRFFTLVELNKYLFKVIDVDFGKNHQW